MNLAAILVDKTGIKEKSLQTFFDITYKKIKNLTPEIYLLSQKTELQVPDDVKIISFQTSNELLNFLSTSLRQKTILILNAYSPLTDIETTKKSLDEHVRFAFDYTFPENIPAGILPEIFDADTAKFILNTVPENLPLFKNSIKELFEKDTSSYDCNIAISPSRLVLYRVNFIPDSYNNFLITKNIIDKYGTDYNHLKLEEYIKKEPDLILGRPTYYEIELTTERESGSSFISTRLNREGEMPLKLFEETIKQISLFSFNPSVSLGLYGEPFLHSDINSIIEIIKEYQEISFLFESRCLFNNIEGIAKALQIPNVKLIFDISASTPEMFANQKRPLNPMLPFEGLSAIEEKINSLPNKEKIYIQYTRTTENEKELVKFYEKWRAFGERLIIKKPDIFGGILENYRVVDLSPIKRFACLHLKHDLSIFFDGTVPLCRQDYNAEFKAGNIKTDGLESCWEKLKEIYKKQWNNIFDRPSVCKKCDEWWIFNL